MNAVVLTVTAKGQVTLRRSVLEHLGVRPGDRLEVSLAPGGKVELTPERPRHDISAIFGLLHRLDRQPPNQEEIDDAVAGAVAEDDDRIRLGWSAAHPTDVAKPRRRSRVGP